MERRRGPKVLCKNFAVRAYTGCLAMVRLSAPRITHREERVRKEAVRRRYRKKERRSVIGLSFSPSLCLSVSFPLWLESCSAIAMSQTVEVAKLAARAIEQRLVISLQALRYKRVLNIRDARGQRGKNRAADIIDLSLFFLCFVSLLLILTLFHPSIKQPRSDHRFSRNHTLRPHAPFRLVDSFLNPTIAKTTIIGCRRYE